MRPKYACTLCLFFALTQALFSLKASAQLPQCDRIYISYLNPTPPSKTIDSLFTYDPGQPVSASNPSLNSIRLPLPNAGLAISPVLGSGSSTLTYYTCTYTAPQNILQYIYYDPVTSTWVNTGHSCGPSNYVNFAAGGGYIYSLSGVGGFPGVYRYDGTGDAVYIAHVSFPSPYDLVADCEGNFYVISYWGPIWTMTKYSPSGSVLQGYTVNNPSLYSFSGGMGIINNELYIDDFHSSGIAHGTITGSTLTFDRVSAPIPFILAGNQVNDFGSCAQMIGGLPTLSVTATDTVVCAGASVTFNSSNTNAGSSPQYQWLRNGVAMPGATNSSVTYSPADNDTFSLQMISNGACSSITVTSPTITIHVQSSSSTALAITATDTVVCAGTSVTFACSNNTSGSEQYQWFKNGVPVPGATDSSLIGVPANNDAFMVQVTGSSSCFNTVISSPVITMHVQAPPAVTFTLAATACKGDTVIAVVDNPVNISYQWNFNTAIVLNGTGAGPYELVWNNPGNYTVTLQATQGTCSGNATKSITVANRPSLQVLPFNNIVCFGDTLKLTVNTDNANQVQWQPGNNYQVVNAIGNTAFIVPSQNDAVVVKVINANGCDTIVNIPFTVVRNCCTLMMPGAFTPNQDGLNDVFRPKGSGIQILSFAIYNRFGQLVFSSHTNNDGWDGSFKGYKQDTGTYVYLVQYQCSNSDKILQQKGVVILIR